MAATQALQVVVMGVSGSGKTTVAQLLAQRWGARLAEADEFHSVANIAKMTSGHPLNDADREPWLEAIAGWLTERAASGETAVVTCSALKRSYRDLLRTAGAGVRFVHLAGSKELIGERIHDRTGHFMPPELLDSQFNDLQPLADDEPGVTLEVGQPPERLAEQAEAALTAEEISP